MSNKHYTLEGFPLLHSGNRWTEWLKPMAYIKTIKYFCQRGWRGYADCDHWDADSYLEAVMLGLISDLKVHSQGYPASMVQEGEEYSISKKRWEETLEKIIEGIEASIELRKETTIPDDVYSKDPLEFVDIGNGFCELQSNTPLFDESKYEEWAKPLRVKRMAAMKLLVKHWGSFWD